MSGSNAGPSSLPACPELLEEDWAWVRLAVTDRTAAVLNRLSIHIGEAVAVARPEHLMVRRGVPIEGFTSHMPIFINQLGAFTYYIGTDVDFSAGRYCSIGADLSIMGERHPIEHVTTSSITYAFGPDFNKPHFLSAHRELFSGRYPAPSNEAFFGEIPRLEHDVWVGTGVTLARGITIGTGAVIGARAVVTKDVAPYTIVAGNPARVIRDRFAPLTARRLLASQWWDHDPRVLFDFDSRNPDIFVDQFERARDEGEIGRLLVPCVDADGLVGMIAAEPMAGDTAQ